MKTIKLTFVAVIIAMLGYLWFIPDHDSRTQPVTFADPVQTTEKVEREVTDTRTSPGKESVPERIEVKEIPSAEDPWHSRANFQEVELWKLGRGYYPSEDLEMYKTYRQETIEQLAESGDIKAIYTLVDLKVAAGATQPTVIDLYMRAAMLGSSHALDMAGIMATPNRAISKFQQPNGDELYKREMLEALSIYQVALIRGDREVMERMNAAKARVDLSPEDLKYVEKRGAEIYSGLEEQRKSLGLGPFDNTVPKIVENYHNEAVTGFRRFIDR